jgi:hypothetical protein
VNETFGKGPLGRPRRRWENGIRMDLREIGLGSGAVSNLYRQGAAGSTSHCKTFLHFISIVTRRMLQDSSENDRSHIRHKNCATAWILRQ